MTENSTSTEPRAAVSANGASVEHGADASLDRLNLEQALLDFELANRRVVDLARRVSSLHQELLATRTELAQLKLQRSAGGRLEARLRASRLFPLARRVVWMVRGTRP